MTFIIALIALLTERFFYWGHLRSWRWFDQYQHLLNMRMGQWPTYGLIFASLFPPVALVGLIQWLIADQLYGILELIFGIGILLYCLGPKNLWAEAYSCFRDLQQEDLSVAIEKVRSAFGITLPDNSQLFHQQFVSSIFIAAYYRVFAVLFWFFILGPMGAILYRLVTLMHAKSPLGVTLPVGQIQRVLDWVPVRIYTFVFALAGHFSYVFRYWKMNALKGLAFTETLIRETGMAALDMSREGKIPENGEAEKEAIALLDRVFIISLVLIAMVVLIAQ